MDKLTRWIAALITAIQEAHWTIGRRDSIHGFRGGGSCSTIYCKHVFYPGKGSRMHAILSGGAQFPQQIESAVALNRCHAPRNTISSNPSPCLAKLTGFLEKRSQETTHPQMHYGPRNLQLPASSISV